jgi:TatD DNase family protein
VYVDSHAHLDSERFSNETDAVIQRARDAGVEAILSIGIGDKPGTFSGGIGFAEKYDWIFASIGVHPHEAQHATAESFAELEELAKHSKVIAWGEIGLDYFYDYSPREIQKQVFLQQMELARSAKKPLIIHCRPSEGSENAWDDTLTLIREHWASSGLGGVLHCFTGGLRHAMAALDLGFVVSFAGNVTFPKAQSIRDVARELPLDRILIETDCPFLAPMPHRGKRNEPAMVPFVAKQLAELRGMSQEDVGRITSQNFYRFFALSEKMPESRNNG